MAATTDDDDAPSTFWCPGLAAVALDDGGVATVFVTWSLSAQWLAHVARRSSPQACGVFLELFAATDDDAAPLAMRCGVTLAPVVQHGALGDEPTRRRGVTDGSVDGVFRLSTMRNDGDDAAATSAAAPCRRVGMMLIPQHRYVAAVPDDPGEAAERARKAATPPPIGAAARVRLRPLAAVRAAAADDERPSRVSDCIWWMVGDGATAACGACVIHDAAGFGGARRLLLRCGVEMRGEPPSRPSACYRRSLYGTRHVADGDLPLLTATDDGAWSYGWSEPMELRLGGN